MEEAYEDYRIINKLDEDINKLNKKQREKFEEEYKKGGNYTYAIKRIYKPSNISRDELYAHLL